MVSNHMVNRRFHPGQRVIYRLTKHSTRPGPRAQQIEPAHHGEDYGYFVDKYWVVAETPDDDTVIVYTRRGKRHELRNDDPNLRAARWWERLFFGGRFPQLPKNAAVS